MPTRRSPLRSPPARPRVGVLAITLLLMSVLGTPAIAAAAPVVTSGWSGSGAVALTFDDGIKRAACANISKTLRAAGAKGTFFINGVHLQRSPGRWKRILRGHAIGNHTRSHPDLTRLSNAGIREQLRSSEAIHRRALDRRGMRVYRPPYGAQDARVRAVAGGIGFKRTVLWNVDTLDWRSSSTVSSIVARATGARPGSIILMHCNSWKTAKALPAIIRHYQRRGIKLAGLQRVLGL